MPGDSKVRSYYHEVEEADGDVRVFLADRQLLKAGDSRFDRY